MSRVNQPPISLVRLARLAKGKEGKIVVVVGTVTDDARLIKAPKLTVCALRFTEAARARILKAGGEVLTFDQLAIRAPSGANTLLLRGRKNARKAVKYFGKPGVPGSTTRYTPSPSLPSRLSFIIGFERLFPFLFFNSFYLNIFISFSDPNWQVQAKRLREPEVGERAEASRFKPSLYDYACMPQNKIRVRESNVLFGALNTQINVNLLVITACLCRLGCIGQLLFNLSA